MPPKKKFRSVRRKKRKFTGNMYTQQPDSQQSMATVADSSTDVSEVTEMPSESCIGPKKQVPASVRKLDVGSSNEDESESPEGNEGFRFIDVGILTDIVRTFWRPDCRCGHVIMRENLESKKGFASKIIFECSVQTCNYKSSFYTSETVQNGKAFEVNHRAVLAGRNIGIGHRGLAKFAGTMNMPPPMNENAYRDHVAFINAAAEVVCKEIMNKASEETKQFSEVEEDGNFDIGISANGTWRRRGFSSSYGGVSGISLVTGKILDVEVISKECENAWHGKERRGQMVGNGNGGKGINTNVIQILKGRPERWMLLDVSLFFLDLLNSMACVILSFLGMGTAKPSIK